jgi:hypothetical protein
MPHPIHFTELAPAEIAFNPAPANLAAIQTALAPKIHHCSLLGLHCALTV